MHFIDVIILIIAIVLIYGKLKNVLGTRPDEPKATRLSDESAAKIFDIIMAETKQNHPETVSDITPEKDLTPIEIELRKIPSFDKQKFLSGAKRAFEMIITAFSKGDIETLEALVSTKLVKKFKEVLHQRQVDGITAETDLIGFQTAEITDVQITSNNLAKISIKFITEQVNLLKNAENQVIEGDENFVQNITDIWTFERQLTSTNPNWLLSSTKK